MEKTDRLLLQRPNNKDLEMFYRINKNPQNNLFNPSGPMKSISIAKKSFTKILDHWNIHDFGQWKIVTKEDDIIGFGGLSYKMFGHEEKLNLGYRIDEKYWGKGYATEIAHFAIQYGINILNKKEIYGLVRPDHQASIRVLEKCNMVKSGELDDVPGQEKSLVFIYRNY